MAFTFLAYRCILTPWHRCTVAEKLLPNCFNWLKVQNQSICSSFISHWEDEFGNLLYLRTIHSFYIIRKMLHNQEDLDLLLHLEATVVTSSGHDYDGTVLLTRDTLFIVGQAADTIQQTLFIKDIDLQEDEEDNRSVAVVNQVVIAKDESEEADGVHDSGDPDRLRQFLKDARAQALEQMATLDSSDSNLTSPGQKFVLLVDPMLRRTLLLQFQSAKRNLISDP